MNPEIRPHPYWDHIDHTIRIERVSDSAHAGCISHCSWQTLRVLLVKAAFWTFHFDVVTRKHPRHIQKGSTLVNIGNLTEFWLCKLWGIIPHCSMVVQRSLSRGHWWQSRAELVFLNSCARPVTSRICVTLWSRLCQMGLCRRGPTRRGCRTGAYKQRPIATIIGNKLTTL